MPAAATVAALEARVRTARHTRCMPHDTHARHSRALLCPCFRRAVLVGWLTVLCRRAPLSKAWPGPSAPHRRPPPPPPRCAQLAAQRRSAAACHACRACLGTGAPQQPCAAAVVPWLGAEAPRMTKPRPRRCPPRPRQRQLLLATCYLLPTTHSSQARASTTPTTARRWRAPSRAPTTCALWQSSTACR